MANRLRAAINGYGRIGRSIVRAVYEKKDRLPIQIVAINGFGGLLVNAHLTEYDTTHGKFPGKVEAVENGLLINNQDYIHFFSFKDPKSLPWAALNIDIVYECTGRFKTRKSAAVHLAAGAKKVIISAPSQDADAMIVYGVNHTALSQANYQIISAASCTTHTLATIIQPLEEQLGIKQGVMTTLHAYTNDQRLLDNHHTDFYRARSATQSMIPTKTGAAATIGYIFPKLAGKLQGLAIRVPTPNVSLLDFSFNTHSPTNIESVNHIFKTASQNALKNVLNYTEKPLVSSDFNHDAASATILGKETIVTGDLVKVLAWYDNEWGFSNRILDITIAWFFK